MTPPSEAEWLSGESLTNLHRMANTPDPRDFYRVSRVVLMPSLWRELSTGMGPNWLSGTRISSEWSRLGDSSQQPTIDKSGGPGIKWAGVLAIAD